MQALLLAAGRSRRAWPLPDKNFLLLGNKTLVEYQVDALKKAGVSEIVLVGNGENAAPLRALFPKLKVVEQSADVPGMAGAVLAAREFLTRPTVVLSTNDLFDPAGLKRVLAAKAAGGALLARRVASYFPGGYLQLAADGKRITGIVEKPGAENEPSDLVTIVCHLFQNPIALISQIEKLIIPQPRRFWQREKPRALPDDLYEQALAQLLTAAEFEAVEYAGAWVAVKYPWHVLDVTAHFLGSLKAKRALKNVKIARTAVISGAVVIEEGVRIFDHAVVTGPVYLGRNAVVGTGSLVRESVVSERAVVGSGSEVARSYLGRGAWLHRNYVGDSVLADNVSLGAGAVTGNLRLDEKEIVATVDGARTPTGRTKFGTVIGPNCRVGVQTCVMPGVLIGGGSFLGSGLTVAENVPDQSFVTGKTELQMRPNKVTIAPRDNF